MIYDLPIRTPTKPFFDRLKWVAVMDRIRYRKSIMVYKFSHNMAPKYMKDMYTYVSKINTRSTRYDILTTSPNCTWPLETTSKYSLTHFNILPQTHGTSYHLMSETAIHLELLRLNYLKWFHSKE